MPIEIDDGVIDKGIWQIQDEATYNAAPSGANVVLDTVENCRVIGIIVKCTWTVQPTPLEIHIHIDGITFTFTVANPVSNTWYYPRYLFQSGITAQQLTTVNDLVGKPYFIEGKSVKIEAEVTGGTVSNITANVKYALKK